MLPSNVIFAHPTLTPTFPATVMRTAEEVINHLENVPADQLWLSSDLLEADGQESLVEYLVMEVPFEGASQIGTIMLFGTDETSVQDIRTRLSPHYTVMWVNQSSELCR